MVWSAPQLSSLILVRPRGMVFGPYFFELALLRPTIILFIVAALKACDLYLTDHGIRQASVLSMQLLSFSTDG